MFDFKDTKEKIKNLEEWLVKELNSVRTGRATPSILDFVQVEAYGGKMLIKELANIIVEDVKTIRIEPWDRGMSKNIEKAVTISNLGLSVFPFDKGLRIIFPDLTAERREQFIKVVKNKLEETRVSLRALRDKTWKAIEDKEKSGGMGEDDKFRLKEEMQKIIDDSNKRFEELVDKKEIEIKK